MGPAVLMSHAYEHIGERYRILATTRQTPVYREVHALDLRERREASLWVIAPTLAGDSNTQRSFMLAARESMNSKVPGALRILGGGVARGMTYLTVPTLGAECLRVRLLRWRPSTTDVRNVVGQLAATLAAAHEEGRFHGLLTARDVLVTESGVVVAGLGMWSALTRRPLLAALQHESIGLAPEARSGGVLGPRADVYSVAAIAAEMLHAATGATMGELRQRGWNPLLIEAIDRALAHGTNARPPTLSGLATALMVRAPSAPPREASQQLTSIELTRESEESTLERGAFRPQPRLPDGRPAAPPPMPKAALIAPPPLPPPPIGPGPRRPSIVQRQPPRALPPRPRVRRATTHSGRQ